VVDSLNIYMENTTQITVQDLGNLHAIVDLAAQRGAFRGSELAQVGAVFDKLTAFLEAVAEQAQAAEGNTDLNESAGAPADSTQGE
jgi:hypothetical protein